MGPSISISWEVDGEAVVSWLVSRYLGPAGPDSGSSNDPSSQLLARAAPAPSTSPAVSAIDQKWRASNEFDPSGERMA
jgi:hypothetical protein